MSGKLGKKSGVSKNLARYKNQYGFNPDRGFYYKAYSNKPTVETLKSIAITYLKDFVTFLFEKDTEHLGIITGGETNPPEGKDLAQWKQAIQNRLVTAFTHLFDKYEDKSMANRNTLSNYGGKPIESMIGFLLNNMNKNVNKKDFETLAPLMSAFVIDTSVSDEDEYVIINGKRMRRLKRENMTYIKSFENFSKED